MSDDIVTRLRKALDEMEIGCLGCSIINLNDHDHDCLTQNAADEIERLRKERDHWEERCKNAEECLQFINSRKKWWQL